MLPLYMVSFSILFFLNLGIYAHQTPLSMEFSRQEYWSGELFPFPGVLTDSGMEHRSLALQADSLPSMPAEKPMRMVKRSETKLNQW